MAIEILVRVHVVSSAIRPLLALHSVVAFSFPMCGRSTRDWIVESANVSERDQVVEFSHISSLDTTDTMIWFWHLA